MRTSQLVAAIAVPAFVVASLSIAAPAMAATQVDSHHAVASATSTAKAPDPMTLSGQAALVKQAKRLVPGKARGNVKLILTETKPSATPRTTDVEIGFADWTTSPVTVYDVTATLHKSSTSFAPMQMEHVKYTPNLDAFTVTDFQVGPAKAAATAKAHDPAVDTSIMDMRHSTLPHQGLSYAFGSSRGDIVVVSGTTGQVL